MGFEHVIAHYGYFGVVVLLALEYVILVVPGETLLTTLGILSHAHKTPFHMPLLILSATLGTFLGSIVTYFIGRLLGRPFILRYGKYVLLTENRLKKTEKLFQRGIVLTILVTKYIAVIRDLVPYVAGIQKSRFLVYAIVQFIASFLWTSTFLLAGTLIEQIGQSIYHHWRTELIPGLIVLAILIFLYRKFHHRIERLIQPKTEAEVPTKQ